MSTFGDEIRRRRHSADLRQTDFARFGITQSRLSMIENGTIVPSPEKIEKLALALKVTALELVGGTKLEDGYLTARYTVAEVAVIRGTVDFTRSQRIVAVQEAYVRVMRFFELLRATPAAQVASSDDEARYQQTLRIVERAIDAARAYDEGLAAGIAMPPSMLDEPDVRSGRGWNVLRRSAALIASLVVEYPEADAAAVRLEIAGRLGLDRIDAYLAAPRPLGSAAKRVDVR